MSELSHFRKEVDHFMAHHPQSPLAEEKLEDFAGLKYFGEDPAFVFTVPVERFADDEPLIEMETSTGEMRLYRRWARFTFMVDEEEATLTIYSDPQGYDFFLPFRDATNGRSTYGAGRYLDNHRPGLQQLSDDMFEVDFNYSYNPYCAYNTAYSCPLPPHENWLSVPIRAGEKNFD
ncbi:MAG: DUF1684 domain-containing protein [Ardenticatenaceae bacterium]|nr:DUF1684 domain-containing protein [Ardenticatenaceae bacterium]MCB8988137.1 DUF1684 domain-containing protein [Ardenticatenaceae bacterium]